MWEQSIWDLDDLGLLEKFVGEFGVVRKMMYKVGT